MRSGLNDDEKRRIETFCETPPYERSPEDLTPGADRAEEVTTSDASGGSVLADVWDRLANRVTTVSRRWTR